MAVIKFIDFSLRNDKTFLTLRKYFLKVKKESDVTYCTLFCVQNIFVTLREDFDKIAEIIVMLTRFKFNTLFLFTFDKKSVDDLDNFLLRIFKSVENKHSGSE